MDDRDDHSRLITQAEEGFPGWGELRDLIENLVSEYGRINAVSLLHFLLYSALYDREIDLALGQSPAKWVGKGKWKRNATDQRG